MLAPSLQRHASLSYALPLREQKQEPGESRTGTGMQQVCKTTVLLCMSVFATALAQRLALQPKPPLSRPQPSRELRLPSTRQQPPLVPHAGDAWPVWGLMAILGLPDGSGRRGLKVFYDAETGKFMVRDAAQRHSSFLHISVRTHSTA